MIELLLILLATGAVAWVIATRATRRIAIGTAGAFLFVGLAVIAMLQSGLIAAIDPAVTAIDGAWRELIYVLVGLCCTALGLAILTIKLFTPRAKPQRR